MRVEHMQNLNSTALVFFYTFQNLWKWKFPSHFLPWWTLRVMKNESLIIWMIVGSLKTSKYDENWTSITTALVFNRVLTGFNTLWNFIPATRSGPKTSDSVRDSVSFETFESKFSTVEKFTCAVTYTYPNASWKSYDGEASRYYIYGICGLKTSQTINGSVLQQSCDNAARQCGNNVECIRNKIVQDQQSGRYSFCPWGGFNLLVNPHPGQSAYKGRAPNFYWGRGHTSLVLLGRTTCERGTNIFGKYEFG